MAEKLEIIKDLEGLAKLKEYLKDKEYVAFDTETDGVLKSSRIIGYSVSAEIDIGYYVITRAWNVMKQSLEDLPTLEPSREIMEILSTKKLVMQNAPFDCDRVQNNYGIELMQAVHTDTMILGHLLDENRSNGLKELGVALFGEDSRKEQVLMKESVIRNGGVLTRKDYELYKADADLIALYGAKDAILTLKVFYTLVTDLYDQGLDSFFYNDESMRLLKGPTYELNTTGLRVDPIQLQNLKGTLEVEIAEDKAFIYKEIFPLVEHKYPGKTPSKTFNIGASKQMSWLLYEVLNNEFDVLTKGGKELCKALELKTPYEHRDKVHFVTTVRENYGRVYEESKYNPKTKKMSRPKKVGNYWDYLGAGKASLNKLSHRYEWIARLLKYSKNLKLLNTYVIGIQERMQYNIIRPSFLQHGTTSGRYSSKAPNFQNLPRDDKRIKACIVSRPGKSFVGADYSQLEPRVFASFSEDKRLLDCFASGDDFYSVIGAEVFDKVGYSLKKDDPNSFAKKFPQLRDISKVVALSSTYGTTAHKMAPTIKKSVKEAQEIIDNYFERFPSVLKLMLESHEMAKEAGRVENLFGRPRRMPKAMEIPKIYGKKQHSDLPYEARNLLNLAINHRIQSTGASIMNRAAIAFCDMCKELAKEDTRWKEVKIVMQVHDELIAECPDDLAEDVVIVMKDAMENTVILPGVLLHTEPKVSKILSELK